MVETTKKTGVGMELAYSYEADLAESTYGKIQLMREHPSKKLFVVKSLKDVNDLQNREHFRREIKILKFVKQKGGHPNIVFLHETIVSTNSVHIVQEYCPKGDMLDLLLSKPSRRFSESIARDYISQIAQGLKFLHSHSISHLDISLENILLSDSGVCKIIDFGFSSHRQDKVQHRMGKLFYAAPEIHHDSENENSQYDGYKADIWSLGVILFMMLTGLPLVGKATTDDRNFRLLKATSVKHLLFVSSKGILSGSSISLLESMLKLSPDHRFNIDQVLNHPWVSQQKPKPKSIGRSIQKKSLLSLPTVEHDELVFAKYSTVSTV